MVDLGASIRNSLLDGGRRTGGGHVSPARDGRRAAACVAEDPKVACAKELAARDNSARLGIGVAQVVSSQLACLHEGRVVSLLTRSFFTVTFATAALVTFAPSA